MISLAAEFKFVLVYLLTIGLFGYCIYRYGRAQEKRNIEQIRLDQERVNQEVQKGIDAYVKKLSDSDLNDII